MLTLIVITVGRVSKKLARMQEHANKLDGRKKPGAGGASFMKFGRARATQRMRIGSFTLFLVAVPSFKQFRHHPEHRSDSKQSWLVLTPAASAWGKEFASFYSGSAFFHR